MFFSVLAIYTTHASMNDSKYEERNAKRVRECYELQRQTLIDIRLLTAVPEFVESSRSVERDRIVARTYLWALLYVLSRYKGNAENVAEVLTDLHEKPIVYWDVELPLHAKTLPLTREVRMLLRFNQKNCRMIRPPYEEDEKKYDSELLLIQHMIARLLINHRLRLLDMLHC